MEISNNTITSEILLKMAYRIPANIPGAELTEETHMDYNNYITEDTIFINSVADTLDTGASDKETTPPSTYGLTSNDYDSYSRFPSQHIETFQKLLLEKVKRSDSSSRLASSYTRYDNSDNSILTNAIQFNYGDGSSYEYFLFINDELIEKGDRQKNWFFDVRSGYITFYGTAPIDGDTVELTFYRYIGKKSIQTLRSEIDTSLQTIETNMDASFASVDQDISQINADISSLETDLSNTKNTLETNFDTSLNNLETRLDASIQAVDVSLTSYIDDISLDIHTELNTLESDVSTIQTDLLTTIDVSSINVSGTIDFCGNLLKNGTKYLPYDGLDNSGSDIIVKGHFIPDISDTYTLGTAEFPFKDLYLGAQSLYVNGTPVIQDKDVGGDTREMTFTTDENQNLSMLTSGSGAIKLQSSGTGALTLISSGADATLQSDTGDVNLTSSSGGVRMDTTSGAITMNSDRDIELNPNKDLGYSLRVNAPLIMGSGQKIQGVTSEPLTVDGDLQVSGITSISGEMIVGGNFTVQGNTSYLDTNITRIKQEILTLNGGESSLSSGTKAGIKINRGDGSDPYFFIFEEGTNSFKIGKTDNLQPVSTREVSPIDTAVAFWNNSTHRVETSNSFVFNSSTNKLTVNEIESLTDLCGQTIYESGTSLSSKYGLLSQQQTNTSGISTLESSVGTIETYYADTRTQNEFLDIQTISGDIDKAKLIISDSTNDMMFDLSSNAGSIHTTNGFNVYVDKDNQDIKAFNITDKGNVGLGKNSINSDHFVNISGGVITLHNEEEKEIMGSTTLVEKNVELRLQASQSSLGLYFDKSKNEGTAFIKLNNKQLGVGSTNENIYLAFGSENTDLGFTPEGEGLNYIPYNGRVGIGTTLPSYPLDVVGNANATTLYEGGTALSGLYGDLNTQQNHTTNLATLDSSVNTLENDVSTLDSSVNALQSNNVQTDQVNTFTENQFILANLDISDNLEVSGNATIHGELIANDGVKSLSDIRFKTNIQDIQNAKTLISKLRGVYFDMNNKRHVGLIAQELRNVIPDAVFQLENGYYGVEYGNLVGLLIEGQKELDRNHEKENRELRDIVQKQQTHIQMLERNLNDLTEKVNTLLT